jgi:hypothetical protein
VLRDGDKCPQCHDGLLEKDTAGLRCSKCAFSLTLAAVEAANAKLKTQVLYTDFKFRPAKFSVTIDDPEEGEVFLRGLVLASQNNNSEYFADLIDAVNAILQPWREARLQGQLAERGY